MNTIHLLLGLSLASSALSISVSQQLILNKFNECAGVIPMDTNSQESTPHYSLFQNVTMPTLIGTDSMLYKTISIGHRTRVQRAPMGAFIAATENDVIRAVKCAYTAGLQPVPRSGGHSYEGFSSQDGALIIDVARLSDVVVLPISSSSSGDVTLAQVGSGARLGNVYTELWNQGGYTFNGGICPSVGMGGHLSGGGYGMSARKYGLAADRVESMRVVLYNGTLLENVSANENADLWWALRGGGSGSFGIITQFTIKVFKEPENTMFSISYGTQDMKSVMRAWMDFAPNADRRLTSQLNMGPSYVQWVGQFHGPLWEFNQIVQSQSRMFYAGQIKEDIRTQDCNALQAKGFIDTRRCSAETLNVPRFAYPTEEERDAGKYKFTYVERQLTDQELDVIVSNTLNAPQGSFVQFEALGGIFSETSATMTPFPHRNMLFSVQYATPVAAYHRNQLGVNQQDSENWARRFENAIQSFISKNRYQNYPDLDLGDDYGTSYWGQENYQRLREIKTKYDPENIFRNEQSVKPL